MSVNPTIVVEGKALLRLKQELGLPDNKTNIIFKYDVNLQARGCFSWRAYAFFGFWIVKPKGKIIINLAYSYTPEAVIKTILHEFRHAWQAHYHPHEFIAGSNYAKQGMAQYLDAWTERDAYAFADTRYHAYRDLAMWD